MKRRRRNACRSRKSGRFTWKRVCGAFKRSLVKLPTVIK